MPRRRNTKRSRSQRTRRRNKRNNNYNRVARSNLHGSRLPVHLTYYAYDFTHSNKDKYQGQMFHQFSSKDLSTRYASAFPEVYFTHITCTYRSRKSANTDGNYCMMILDNDGDDVKMEANWTQVLYKKACGYPGARIRKMTQNCTLTWKPSEAGDKNYFSTTSDHKIFSLFWVRDYADSTTIMDGEVEIRAWGLFRSGAFRSLSAAQVIRELTQESLTLDDMVLEDNN